ncbi:MAG: FkbM family methyltransferase [Verrucomicrobiota bacterium]
MKRFLKNHIGRFLPDALRASIKTRMAAKFTQSVSTKFSVKELPSALKCTIDNLFSFLAPLVCKNDLANLTDTVEGRAEFHSLALAALAGGILFDVGAHSGLISAMFCAAQPRNRAVAFEPSTVLAERLAAIRELNQFGERMRIESIGIGKETKIVEMVLDPAGGFIQTQRFDHTMWAAPEPVQIRIESLQDAASRLDIIPHFIKIDIEGYEFEAIQGSVEFLARHKPSLFLELHLNYLEQRDYSAKRLVDMLQQCSYAFYTSTGSRLKPSDLYDSPLPIVHVVAR